VPSVLWRCWLGGRKGIRPVKTEWWGAGVVICLELGADLHMAQLMPLPLTVSCSSKIQIGCIFLVPAHLGSATILTDFVSGKGIAIDRVRPSVCFHSIFWTNTFLTLKFRICMLIVKAHQGLKVKVTCQGQRSLHKYVLYLLNIDWRP